jgi:lipopolysaccharide export system ATP-binding protein
MLADESNREASVAGRLTTACLQRLVSKGLGKAGMVDLLGMFRRRPAKRGKGFARSREDITALGDSFGDMLTSPVRDAPPMAREAPIQTVAMPRAPAVAQVPRDYPPGYSQHYAQDYSQDYPSQHPDDYARETPREVPPQPRPQARAKPAPPAKPAPQPAKQAPPAKSARPAKGNGSAGPQLLRRPGFLAVHSVEKSFGKRQVVRGVSIYVRRGEAVGLLGPNGAGKTTVFYMITGLIKADRGAIELDGHDVTKLPMYQRARLGIGYLPQEASIFRGLTVEQNIRAVLEVVEPSKKKREAELDSLLNEFNITRLRKTPSIALSGGERRRVEIARALATRPNYMLLDEPFAGIDPIAVGDIQDLVRHLTNRGIGVLITDHNVRETLGLTDRAYIVYAGEILTEGSPDEIVNDPDVRRLYLGEEFRL